MQPCSPNLIDCYDCQIVVSSKLLLFNDLLNKREGKCCVLLLLSRNTLWWSGRVGIVSPNKFISVFDVNIIHPGYPVEI